MIDGTPHGIYDCVIFVEGVMWVQCWESQLLDRLLVGEFFGLLLMERPTKDHWLDQMESVMAGLLAQHLRETAIEAMVEYLTA